MYPPLSSARCHVPVATPSLAGQLDGLRVAHIDVAFAHGEERYNDGASRRVGRVACALRDASDLTLRRMDNNGLSDIVSIVGVGITD